MTSQASTLADGNVARTTDRSALRALVATGSSWAPALQRATLAVVLFPHGAQKLLGWWGGYGFEGTHGFLTESIGLTSLVATAVILLEAFGPVLLLLGLLVRPVALAVVGLMAGAIATVHAPFGFFMNWTGAQAGEGFEYHLLAIALAAGLALTGAGRLSLDGVLARRG